MRRGVSAVCLFALLGAAPQAGLAMRRPVADAPNVPVVLIQSQRDLNIALLDARLEAAAMTAALVRSLNVNLKTALSWPEKDANDKEFMRMQAARIGGAIDAALESYMRLIGQIASDTSDGDLAARTEALDKDMGFRGQSPIKAGLPVITQHIKAIRAGVAPTTDDVRADLLAIRNR